MEGGGGGGGSGLGRGRGCVVRARSGLVGKVRRGDSVIWVTSVFPLVERGVFISLLGQDKQLSQSILTSFFLCHKKPFALAYLHSSAGHRGPVKYQSDQLKTFVPGTLCC